MSFTAFIVPRFFCSSLPSFLTTSLRYSFITMSRVLGSIMIGPRGLLNFQPSLADAPELVAALLDADCELTACSNSAAGLALPDGVVRGSQDDHAAVVATSDRVVALT